MIPVRGIETEDAQFSSTAGINPSRACEAFAWTSGATFPQYIGQASNLHLRNRALIFLHWNFRICRVPHGNNRSRSKQRDIRHNLQSQMLLAAVISHKISSKSTALHGQNPTQRHRSYLAFTSSSSPKT